MKTSPFNMDALLHHIEHLVIYSLIIWQITLSIFIVIKYWIKNRPIVRSAEKYFYGGDDNSPRVQSGGPIGVVDVGVEKKIFIDKVDSSSVKMDDVVKGKVSTKKDKLKKIRL
tara:strand:- start:275 stop:613 length:339 start_codon:yes stop_codon:yes gene_type:complete